MIWLLDRFIENKNKSFLHFKGQSYSYFNLYEDISNKEKEILNYGIKEGDTICVIGDFSLSAISILLALAKNKCIIVPIPQLSEDEIGNRVKISNSKYIIKLNSIGSSLTITKSNESSIDNDLIVNLKNQGSSGLILFSSGSTGIPKAMIHNLDNILETFKNKNTKGLNFLLFLMFDHIGGLNTLFNILSMCVEVSIPENRSPEHISMLIEQNKINVLPTSPTFLNLLLLSREFSKYDLSSLKLITYGTEPMTESLLMKLKSTFPKVKFLQTFGTSETGISIVNSYSSTSNLIKFDDPNTEYKVVENELWLKSKTRILGYLNYSNEKLTNDGWFKTGDIVEQKDNGYLRIIGRNNEIINVGGLKVLPIEVENILMEIPEIIDCIVRPSSHPITGQVVAVDVVVNQLFSEKNLKKIIVSHCKGKIETYKIPVIIKIVDKLEVTDRYKKKRKVD